MTKVSERDGYYISVVGDLAVIGWTDQNGTRSVLEMPTTEARKFFKAGALATQRPITVGGWLWQKICLKINGGYSY